jgi:hypothetical protein
MKKVTTYGPFDLTHGKCKCCGETSPEIVIGEDMCADCVQAAPPTSPWGGYKESIFNNCGFAQFSPLGELEGAAKYDKP